VNGGLKFRLTTETGHGLVAKEGTNRSKTGRLPRVTRRLRDALRALLLFAAGSSIFSADIESAHSQSPAPADVEEKISPWDWSGTLRTGVGYKDNILLSDFFKESSVFTFAGAEAFVFRVPTDGWEYTGFISGEDRRYWASDIVPKEQYLLVSSDLKKAFLEKWKTGLGLQYFYNDQVFDASVTEGLPFRVRAKLNRFSGAPSVQYRISDRSRLEAYFNVVREEFELPLDDSWETGPRVVYVHKYGEIGSEISTTVLWRHRTYDTRSAPSFDDKSLVFNVPEFEFGLKHNWDDEKRWKSRVRMGLELNRDNGDGFFDYHRWKVSHELDFTQGGFEGILQAKFLHYEYPNQTVEDAGSQRRRTELVFGARAKQRIMNHLSAFVELEHERVLATDIEERYHATTIWGGVEWEVK
jgi:hypothetical protein